MYKCYQSMETAISILDLISRVSMTTWRCRGAERLSAERLQRLHGGAEGPQTLLLDHLSSLSLVYLQDRLPLHSHLHHYCSITTASLLHHCSITTASLLLSTASPLHHYYYLHQYILQIALSKTYDIY